ncbi:MAG: hypothetical protein KKD44_27055 [Proteobacteria bacterium]|nr:hypothetical protein [Pseudomonadota bacterium]
MQKIETIFDRGNNFKVTAKIRAGTEWVFEGKGIATEKLDGTNIRITVKNGTITKVEKRCNPTKQEKLEGAEPGYIDAHKDDPSNKHIFRAVDNTNSSQLPDGEYPCEAVGPKIQGNPLELNNHICYLFTYNPVVVSDVPRTFQGLREFIEKFESNFSPGHKAEGIVFHHPDGKMAKIKRKDF